MFGRLFVYGFGWLRACLFGCCARVIVCVCCYVCCLFVAFVMVFSFVCSLAYVVCVCRLRDLFVRLLVSVARLFDCLCGCLLGCLLGWLFLSLCV